MIDEKALQRALKAAGKRAEALRLESEAVQLTPDMPAWFNAVEQIATGLPKELPRGPYLVELIERGRAQYQRGEDADLRVTVLQIVRNIKNAKHDEWAAKKEKFDGRGRGAGPIRKWIRGQLAKNPSMKNRDLWAAFVAKPLRGYVPCYNRVGRYIEKSGATVMGGRRFDTICGEERKRLKG